ncbi:MAG: hypothetical protein WCD28_06620 [Nitrososphaeraceae archaeon]
MTITETNYGIRVDIINYLNACCTLAYSLITTPYEERITSLKVFENYMSVLGNELVMKILLYFGANVKGMDDLPILAKDDKFMKVVDDLHKYFERSFDMATRMRKRP